VPGEFSQRGAELALDAWSGRVTAAARTTYLALLTAAPNDQTTVAGMAELAVAGYARQAVTWGAPSGDPSQIANSAPIVFGPFTADAAPVTHCALVSSASGGTGDFLGHWALEAAKDAAAGESIQFAAGQLTMNLE
jgi:hypothetical protein